MTSEHDDCGISDVVCGVCRTARSEEADQDDPAETGDVLVSYPSRKDLGFTLALPIPSASE